jgi:hypothetical protein
MLRRLGLFCLLGLLGGCDVGSHLANRPELTQETYPDINTVPFGEEARASRAWHGGQPEEKARGQDQHTLDGAQKRLCDEGAKLREEAGLPPRDPLPSPSKSGG